MAESESMVDRIRSRPEAPIPRDLDGESEPVEDVDEDVDEDDEDEDERIYQETREEFIRELQTIIMVVALPWIGKYYGRRFSYWIVKYFSEGRRD